jgi:hypothetical protein
MVIPQPTRMDFQLIILVVGARGRWMTGVKHKDKAVGAMRVLQGRFGGLERHRQ